VVAQPETGLEMARRHVAEGEARCARQREIIAEMVADNHPNAAVVARQVLATLETTLTLMRDHLRQGEERHTRGGAGA
jgi:hypothetical protein